MGLVFVIWGYLFIVSILPGIIVFSMPGKKSMLTATMFFLYLNLMGIDYGRLSGEGYIFEKVIFASILLGLILKSTLIYRKSKKNNVPFLSWTKKDSIFISAFLFLGLFWLLINVKSVCLPSFQVTTKEDILERHVKNTKEANKPTVGLYDVRKARRSILGQFRWSVSKVVIHDPSYTSNQFAYDTYFELNSCGKVISQPLTMGENKADFLKRRQEGHYTEIGDIDGALNP